MINVNDFFSNGSANGKDADYVDYTGVIAGVKSCANINGSSYILVDFDKRKPIFLSDNLLYLDEASNGDYRRVCANPYWSLISDETLEILGHIQADYYSLKSMMSEEEYCYHLSVSDYPIVIRGKKFYINSRFSPIYVGEDRRIRLGLFSFVPSSKKEISFMVIAPSGKRLSYDFNKRKFKEFDIGLRLTIAEKAILHRARKGMTNEEIASDLFLSLNTVKSHKLHIFKKLNVTSITEALVVIGNYKLL